MNLGFAFDSPELSVEIVLDRGGVLCVDPLETGCGDLSEVDFLCGTRSLLDKITTVFAKVKVNDDQPPTWTQCAVDRGQHFLRVIEVMVRVADKGNLDRTGGQHCGVLGVQHACDDSLVSVLLGLLSDVLEKCRPDVYGVDGALRTNLLGEEQREQAGAGADVRHGIAGLQANGATMS